MKPKTVAVPETIVHDTWLSPMGVRVWACYAVHADRDGVVERAAAELAAALGCSTITVHRAVAELTRAGYLERLGTGPSKRRRLVIR